MLSPLRLCLEMIRRLQPQKPRSTRPWAGVAVLGVLALTVTVVTEAGFGPTEAGSGLAAADSAELNGPQVIDFDPWEDRRRRGWRDQIGGGVQGLAVTDDTLYAAVGWRIHAYDVSDPARPSLIGRSLPLAAYGLNHEELTGLPEVVLAHNGSALFTYAEQGRVLIALEADSQTAPSLAASRAQLGGSDHRQLFFVGGEMVENADLAAGGSAPVSELRWWDVQPAEQLTLVSQGRTNITTEERVQLALSASGDSFMSADVGHDYPVLGWHTIDRAARALTLEHSLELPHYEEWISLDLVGDLGVGLAIFRNSDDIDMYLNVVDVAPPSEMTVRARVPVSLSLSSGPPPLPQTSRAGSELIGQDGFVYLPVEPGSRPRIASVDLSDPEALALRNGPTLNGYANELRLTAGHLWVGNPIDLATTHADPPPRYSGLDVFDISEPGQPVTVGGPLEDAWNAIDVATVGDHAAVAAATAGLRVIDLTNPDQAREVSTLGTLGDVTAVRHLSGTLVAASVAAGPRQGIVVVDLNDPTFPRIVGHLPLPSHPEVVDLDVVAAVVVLVTWDGFIHVVNLTDPTTPRLEATVDTAPRGPAEPTQPIGARVDVVTRAIAAEEHRAFVGHTAVDGTRSWVTVVDLTQPARPEVRQHQPLAETDPMVSESRDAHLFDIAVSDRRVAVGHWAGIHFLSVAPDGALVPRGSTSGSALALAWRGEVLVADHHWLGHRGIDACDLDNPESLPFRRGIELAAPPWRRHWGIDFMSDGTILDAAGVHGLLIAEAIDPPTCLVPTDSPTPPTPTASSTVASPTVSPQATASSTTGPTPTPTETHTTSPSPSLPTPSASPSSTNIGTATSTPTATRTSTASATTQPSNTPAATKPATLSPPAAIYLPIALFEQCPPADLFTDVVLIIDASTSMLDRSDDGPRKIDAAVDAAGVFLDDLRLRPGGDRAAVVTFNATAQMLQPLTHDRAALASALERVTNLMQTRIDLGIETAAVEWLAHGRRDAVGAMIILSDGRANPVSSAEVIASAERARSLGLDIFAVGLGSDRDEPTLQAVAGEDERYYASPTVSELRSVYGYLARTVPCPPMAYWGRR